MVRVIDNYTLIQKIGQGSYGEVYRATNSKKSGEFAVKVIPNQKFIQNNLLEQCTINQIKTLSTIGPSQFIVKYEDHFKTRNNYYFVYQYCNGGTLLEAVKKQGHFTEKKSLLIFKQLIEAFKTLNRFNIMHRDLKPQNIFFHNGKVKLGDFGFCKGLKPGENMTKTMLGSPIYMAPQVLRGENYSTKADIWSLGVVLYEMLFGNCPFQSNSIAMLISTISSTDFSIPLHINKISEKTQTLLKRLLTKDYFRRISWVEIFGFKIDEEGNFLQNDNQCYSPYTNANKSYSNIKEEQQKTQKSIQIVKKPNSTPKDNGKMTVYSDKYLNAVSQPLNISNSKGTQRKISVGKEDYLQKLDFKQPKYRYDHKQQRSQKKKQKNNISILEYHESKRQILLKKHEQCLEDLKQSLKMLQRRQQQVLKQVYIKLSLIHVRLKQITDDIKITQTDLLDVASLINYEIIQVDRQLIQTKQQMIKRKIAIPKDLNMPTMKSMDGMNPDIKAFVYINNEVSIDQ